jgi:hypothetical protein
LALQLALLPQSWPQQITISHCNTTATQDFGEAVGGCYGKQDSREALRPVPSAVSRASRCNHFDVTALVLKAGRRWFSLGRR